MRIIDRLKERDAFTPAENQIAEFIRENHRDVVNMPLDRMAEKLYVSKSTIIRFCKKLGFHGHKELCVQLAKEQNAFLAADAELNPSMPFEGGDDGRMVTDKLAAVYYRAVSETYQELDQEKLSRIGKQIREKKGVCIYAEENHESAASFASKLETIGIRTIPAGPGRGCAEQAYYQPAEYPALIISYYGRESTLSHAVRILTERKIPYILITGPFGSGLKKNALECVEVSFYEPQPRIAPFGSAVSISFVLDTLFAYLFSLDYEKNNASVRGTGEIRRKISENTETARNPLR